MVERDERVWAGWQGVRVFLVRLLVFGVVWWVISSAATRSWPVGGPVVVLAALLSSCMLPPLRFAPAGALAFAGFFLWESLRGGIDVARRALHRRLPLHPDIVEFSSRLDAPAARASAINTLCLLPGTLVVDLTDHRFRVHALDVGSQVEESVRRTGRRVSALFRPGP